MQDFPACVARWRPSRFPENMEWWSMMIPKHGSFHHGPDFPEGLTGFRAAAGVAETLKPGIRADWGPFQTRGRRCPKVLRVDGPRPSLGIQSMSCCSPTTGRTFGRQTVWCWWFDCQTYMQTLGFSTTCGEFTMKVKGKSTSELVSYLDRVYGCF